MALLTMTQEAAESPVKAARDPFACVRTALDRCRAVTEFPHQAPRGYNDATLAAEIAELVQWMIWRRQDAQMDTAEAQDKMRRLWVSSRNVRSRRAWRAVIWFSVGVAVGVLAAAVARLA